MPTNSVADLAVDSTQSSASNSIDVLGYHIEPGDYSMIAWLFVAYMVFRVVMPVVDAWRKNKIAELESHATTEAEKEAQERRVVNAETQRQILITLKELHDDMKANKVPGVRMRQESIDMFIGYQDKNHIRIMRMLLTRILENHIGTEQDDIAEKWLNLAEKLSGKTVNFFKKVTHNGRPLSDFWAGSGAKQYYKYICSELFAMQVVAHEEGGKPLNYERIDRSLSHNLSRLTSEFVLYLDTGVGFLEQWDDTKPQYSIQKPFHLDEDIVVARHP